MAKCLLCDSVSGHDPRCPYVVPTDKRGDELTDAERQMFEERADEWLREGPANVERFLNRAAMVTLQKLVKDSLIPGGKDPATTSLRAIGEVVKANVDWMKGKKDDESPGKGRRSRLVG